MTSLQKETMWWDSIVPFVSMFLIEGVTIALTISASSAMQLGMNQFVFVAYSNALSSLILIPYCIFYHKERMRDAVGSVKLLARFFLLGLIGTTIAQNLAFTGLLYSSPIVVCGMGLLLPCFQYFFALLQGKTSINLRRTSTKMRLPAILVSFGGGAVVMLYQGPSIIQSAFFHPQAVALQGSHPHPLMFFLSSTPKWVFGTVLLGCSSFCLALWGTVQVDTINVFPDVMVIVSCGVAFGTVQTAVVDLLAEQDLSAWKLGFNFELCVIVCTAIFGTFVRSKVQAWCTSMKGPMYVPLFKPFGIFWACLISLSLFGNSLHYGSVIGCCITGVGYYTMLWAVKKEAEEVTKTPSDEAKTPLLQQHRAEQRDHHHNYLNHHQHEEENSNHIV